MTDTDIIASGLARGWKVTDASTLRDNQVVDADVVIIGTGAGGGTTAEILAQAGLSVVLVEEGRLYYQKDFRMDAQFSYSHLYQEGMSRVTADGAIAILQGRCVGGSTTVNWTSSFHTPDETLNHWAQRFGVRDASPEAMKPWFADREKRLNIHPWQQPPNVNNATLARGCQRLGFASAVIPRNVRHCWNTGYCGFGCPTNAKQGMLVTTVPGALDAGARLYHCLRAEKLVYRGDRVLHLEGTALDSDALSPTGVKVELRARHFVVAASAIGTPGLLLRSRLPDPYSRVGKRTFLHPVNATTAIMPEKVEPYYGAPQSIYSDEFVWKQGVAGPVGYKLEVPPLHPTLTSGVIPGHGETEFAMMQQLPRMQSIIALLRDGFHEDSPGGTVRLRDDGSPVLDYPLTDYLWDGFRRAYLTMTEIQFAAGADKVRLVHMDSPLFSGWPEAKAFIRAMKLEPQRTRLFTAHQMGGCAMGEDPRQSVVNSYGEHHHLANLNVHDASTFPTSIGANPQLSVYAFATRNARRLADRLTDRKTAS